MRFFLVKVDGCDATAIPLGEGLYLTKSGKLVECIPERELGWCAVLEQFDTETVTEQVTVVADLDTLGSLVKQWGPDCTLGVEFDRESPYISVYREREETLNEKVIRVRNYWSRVYDRCVDERLKYELLTEFIENEGTEVKVDGNN